jgi:hypothetical protein
LTTSPVAVGTGESISNNRAGEHRKAAVVAN